METQCCISSLTGSRKGLERFIAYTALTSSVSSGNIKSPPTRTLMVTCTVSEASTAPCGIVILIPYSSQLTDWVDPP